MEISEGKTFYEWVDIWENSNRLSEKAYALYILRDWGVKSLPYFVDAIRRSDDFKGFQGNDHNVIQEACLGIEGIGPQASEAQEALYNIFEKVYSLRWDKASKLLNSQIRAEYALSAFVATKPGKEYIPIIMSLIDKMIKQDWYLGGSRDYAERFAEFFASFGESIIPTLLEWRKENREVERFVESCLKELKRIWS